MNDRDSPLQETVPMRPGDLTLSAHAHGDGVGRLFRWENDLYRAISPDHAPLFRRLHDSGLLSQLADQGLLVRSEPVTMDLPGTDLVFKHDTLPFVTYPAEWCGAMLKAAALCTLDLQVALLEHDATLVDAHAWNIIFDGPSPVMVDLTAIAERSEDEKWSAEQDFRFCMQYPAMLASRGKSELGRLLTDTLTVRDRDITALLPFAFASWCRHTIWRLRHRLGLTSQSPTRLIRRLASLRRKIDQLKMPTAPHPETDSNSLAWLGERVKQFGSGTALAVGCSGGPIPTVLANSGVKTLACQADEAVTNALFSHATQQQLDILPLAIDIFAQSSAFGTFERNIGPIARRLCCDLVVSEMDRPGADPVACAQTDQRVQTLVAFAKRAAIVRITDPPGDKSAHGIPDLKIEGLLRRHTREVSRLEGAGQEVWYLCEV